MKQGENIYVYSKPQCYREQLAQAGTVSALTEIPEDPIIENVETKIG